MKQIGKSLEDYLEAILLLEINNSELRSIDISKHLNVSKPAVTKALKKLADANLVEKESYEDVRFTKKGRELAKKIYHRHMTIKKALISIGVDKKTAEIDCCKIEHVISEKTLIALDKLIKNKVK